MPTLTKHLFLLFLVLSMGTRLYSQNALIDSLKLELSNHPKEDKERAVLLNTIAFKHYGINQIELRKYAFEGRALAHKLDYPKEEGRSWYLESAYQLSSGQLDSAMSAIKTALELYKKSGFLTGVSTSYDLMGTISRYQEDYPNSIVYFERALKIARDSNDHFKEASFLSNMGSVYSMMGEMNKAIASYKASIEVFDSLGVKEKALSSMSNIGLTYTRQGRNLEALTYFQKCLSGYRENGNKIFGAGVLQNIGLVYSNIEEYEKAIPYLEESLEINQELGNELEIAKNKVSLGSIYHKQNDLSTALKLYSESLEISERLDNKEGKFNSYTNIGSLHFDKFEYRKALENFNKSLEVSYALGAKRLVGESHISVGGAYIELGKYDEALENINKGKSIAKELSLLGSQKKANMILARLYEKRGDYKKALETYKLYKLQSDSLINRQSIEDIAQVEIEYKYKQELDSAKTRELLLTKTVTTTSLDLARSQRNLFLGVIGFLLISILLGSIIFYQKYTHIKASNQNIVTEQKLLRSQMTPHFIFNSLSVLQGMILNKEEKNSISYLSKFSKLLRTILENSRHQVVSLSTELSAIDSYIALQNLTTEPPYQYQLNVASNINADEMQIPPMLIQPFLENVVEHAFVENKPNKEIKVDITLQKGALKCIIADNGIGINLDSQKNNKNKKSLATTITTERLSGLSKDFKMEGSIKVENRNLMGEQGTLVTLIIPYKTV